MGVFRVKELAIARGMSQEDLAIKSGVKMHTVQRIWQNTIERPYADTLIALADALGVSVKELYTDGKGSYTPRSKNTRPATQEPVELAA